MTSTSEEVQTTTETSACSAATAMRSAGSIFVAGSTWTVVFPMETVMVRAVALRHVVVLVVLEALEPGVRLVVRMELRRRESGGEGGGGESGKRGGGSGGRGSDGDVELAGGAAGGAAGGLAGGGRRRPQCRPTLLLVALVATWT